MELKNHLFLSLYSLFFLYPSQTIPTRDFVLQHQKRDLLVQPTTKKRTNKRMKGKKEYCPLFIKNTTNEQLRAPAAVDVNEAAPLKSCLTSILLTKPRWPKTPWPWHQGTAQCRNRLAASGCSSSSCWGNRQQWGPPRPYISVYQPTWHPGCPPPPMPLGCWGCRTTQCLPPQWSQQMLWWRRRRP